MVSGDGMAFAFALTSSAHNPTESRADCPYGFTGRRFAAAMTVYLKYQHYQADVNGDPALTDLDDLDLISAGGLINF